MQLSARVFLEGLIDYAGLFPPAGLDLEPALRNYAGYRRQAESFMLGRFIIPAARLTQLAPFDEELFRGGDPWRLSVLGLACGSWDEWSDTLAATLRAADEARTRHGARLLPEVYELRLPEPVRGREQVLADALAAARDAQPDAGFFIEAALGGLEPRQAIDEIRRLLAVLADGRVAGFKLRCGGVAASLYPPAEVVAAALRGPGAQLARRQ